MNVLKPVFDGIKGSFMLSADIVLAVGAVLYSFAHHSLNLKDTVAGRTQSSDSSDIGLPSRK